MDVVVFRMPINVFFSWISTVFFNVFDKLLLYLVRYTLDAQRTSIVSSNYFDYFYNAYTNESYFCFVGISDCEIVDGCLRMGVVGSGYWQYGCGCWMFRCRIIIRHHAYLFVLRIETSVRMLINYYIILY